MLEKSDKLTIKLVGSVDASAERPLPTVSHGASGLAGITDHTSVEDDLAGLDGSSSSLSELGGGSGGGGGSGRSGGGRGGGSGRRQGVNAEDVLTDVEGGSNPNLMWRNHSVRILREKQIGCLYSVNSPSIGSSSLHPQVRQPWPSSPADGDIVSKPEVFSKREVEDAQSPLTSGNELSGSGELLAMHRNPN